MSSKLKNYIAGDFFRGKMNADDILEALYKRKAAGEENFLRLGQLIGHGVTHEVKMQERENNGKKEMQESISIIGTFEAVNYETGEVVQSTSVYLPKYFARALVAMLKTGDGSGAGFAVEIGVELTGRTIPYAWAVARLGKENPESPLQRLKRQLQAEGSLRLPPPVSNVPVITHVADETYEKETPSETVEKTDKKPAKAA